MDCFNGDPGYRWLLSRTDLVSYSDQSVATFPSFRELLEQRMEKRDLQDLLLNRVVVWEKERKGEKERKREKETSKKKLGENTRKCKIENQFRFLD